MTRSGLDPYAPLPPLPTQADLWNPEYAYLKCKQAWCCANTRQDLIADWVNAGIPAEWHHAFGNWRMAGYTRDQVLSYAPPADDPFYQPRLVTSMLSDLIKAGVTGDQMRHFLRAGVFVADHMIALLGYGADPAAFSAYVAAQVTEDTGADIGAHHVAKYTQWTQINQADPSVVNALMARHTAHADINTVTTTWSVGTYPDTLTPDRVIALSDAGITPTELATQPELATAPLATLATLAALRA